MGKRKTDYTIQNFRLPRYSELPNNGLYLDQTVQYMNDVLAPLGCITITSSMISNYVKKGLVNSPVKKQYLADQICHLFVIAIIKQVLPMEHIATLFEMQQKVYPDAVAYDYFCSELENLLQYIYGFKDTVEDIGVTSSREKTMLRNTIISVSHMIYLDECFRNLKTE